MSVADERSPETRNEGRWRTSRAVPVLIVLIAVGLIGAIVLISRQEQDAGQQALAATTIDAAALPATVPYREVAGHLVIDVTLGDGSRTVPMIIDTGAPTIVSEEVAEVFGSGSSGTISTASFGGRSEWFKPCKHRGFLKMFGNFASPDYS